MRKIIFVVLLLSVASALHAAEMPSIDVKFFGDIKVDGFYYYDSKERSTYNSVIQGFDLTLGSKSFVGTNISIGDKIKLFAVLQPVQTDIIKQLYFTYDMGEYGFLTVGKDFSTAGYFFGQISEDANYMRGYGTLNRKRSLQIRYAIKGVEVGLVSRLQDTQINYGTVTNFDKVKNEDIFPRVELSYKYDLSNGFVRAFGTYGYYSSLVFLKDGTNKSYASNAYDIGLASSLKFGIFDLKLTAFFAYNAALFGGLTNEKYMPTYSITTKRVDDIQSFGGAAAVDVEVIENSLIVRAGIGYMGSMSRAFIDLNDLNAKPLDSEMIVFAGLRYLISKNFHLVPEIAYMDSFSGQKGQAEGSRFVAGLQLNMVF